MTINARLHQIIRNVLFVPIKLGNHAIGVFEVANKSVALQLEAWIKRHSRAAKQRLIQRSMQPPVENSLLSAEAIRQMNSALRSQ